MVNDDDPAEESSNICKHWSKGERRFGERCRFARDPRDGLGLPDASTSAGEISVELCKAPGPRELPR